MKRLLDAGTEYDDVMSLPFTSFLRVYETAEALGGRMRGSMFPAENLDGIEMIESLLRACSTEYQPFPLQQERMRMLFFPSSQPGRVLYSPAQLQVRSLLAAEALTTAVGEQLAYVLLPVEAVQTHLSGLEVDNESDKVHSRTATWGVPLAWFALFSEGDESETFERNGRMANYRIVAHLSQARERLRWAIDALENAVPEMDLLGELQQMLGWLTQFDDDAAIALDYGQVVDRVYPDDSPSDLRMGIECLIEQDLTGAAAAYRRLANRWMPIKQLARAS